MKQPQVERLPADRAELEERWPEILALIMSRVKSPANPDQLAAELKNAPDFMALIQGWERMPTASQANAWNMIQERLFDAAMATRPFCVRCGECCRRGSPALFGQDLPTLASGAIARKDLVTVRRGERAFSNRQNRLVALEREQVKIREGEDGRCVFLAEADDACLIYEDRPHQCRVMECWDASRFDTVQNLPPLTRLDLLGRDNPLSRLIIRHGDRAGAAELEAALAAEAPDEAAALDLILFDFHTREFAGRELGLDEMEMDFFFGRPLAWICRGFGWRFGLDDEGRPVLERIAPDAPPDLEAGRD